MPGRFADAAAVMRRALELAALGVGAVEPNPPVGAVLVDDRLNGIAEGYHQRFGGPHAEIEAISAAGERASGATLFVTLEPCCHQGKTGPCTEAIARAGIRKVVVALTDPFPDVNGKGIEWLRWRGIDVEVGLLAEAARRLVSPFLKLVTTGEPWLHAKWAMSLDGKIATRTGGSRWISGDASRALVHRLRGRVDGVLVGAATVIQDDPLLTARPPGPRVATRIVVDSEAKMPITSQLARTAREAPLLIAASADAPTENVQRLVDCGAEVQTFPSDELDAMAEGGAGQSGPGRRINLRALMRELGRRRFTNVLAEGGGRLLGSLFDRDLVDEVHVFVAPKIVGGAGALSAVLGDGIAEMKLAAPLTNVVIERVGDDVYINGRRRPA